MVSVVIPCYNHQDYVQQTIQSVIDQDYINIELIIIDDGSSDSSVIKIREMISLCEKRFKRFEFRNRPNKGLCATLNEALEWCEGEFFSAIASDDILLPLKTKRQVELFLNPKNHNIAAITGETISINANGKRNTRSSFVPPKERYYTFLDIYRGNSQINAPTAMIRMHCVKEAEGYNTDVIVEDFYMWLAITKLGYQILAVDDIYAQYRIHNSNTFSKIQLMHESTKKIRKIFMPNEYEYIAAIKYSNLRMFKAASVYEKRYALNLLLSGKVNIFSKDILFYIVVLLLPRSLFMFLLKVYRDSKIKIGSLYKSNYFGLHIFNKMLKRDIHNGQF